MRILEHRVWDVGTSKDDWQLYTQLSDRPAACVRLLNSIQKRVGDRIQVAELTEAKILTCCTDLFSTGLLTPFQRFPTLAQGTSGLACARISHASVDRTLDITLFQLCFHNL